VAINLRYEIKYVIIIDPPFYRRSFAKAVIMTVDGLDTLPRAPEDSFQPVPCRREATIIQS
jgi:hypothetical protein